MKKRTLASIAVLAGVFLFTASASWAQAIDGGYVGTAMCAGCHSGENADFQKSGHPYKYRTTYGDDCGMEECDPISNILPNPAIAGILTLTNDDLILDDGDGNLDWSVINYIIGGFGWKARFGILDATDADGDGINDTGFVWTGDNVQWNALADGISRPQWSNYHGGEDKAYNCGICHNTNGTRDMEEDRTEPWASHEGGDGEGYTSQWTFDGVQCEACHGPGADHVAASPRTPYPVDTSAEMCGSCHNRDGADLHGSNTSKGYGKHHQQYNEMVGNTLEPGVHASLTCVDCHDPHLRSHTVPDATATALGITDNDLTAEERGAVISCDTCHPSTYVNFMPFNQCIDCHMSEPTKSATGEDGTYGKQGDVKSHIFAINPDDQAEDTNASPNSVTGTNVQHNYITLNYACGKCHDSSMSTFVGRAFTMEELGEYAEQIHVKPGVAGIDKCKLKAGKKKDNTDKINFSGFLDAIGEDFLAELEGNVVVTIEADGIADLEFTFPINADTFKKPDFNKPGKYKSQVKGAKGDPVTKFSMDFKKGTMKFDGKNLDLTGLSCPFTVRIEIGSYGAVQELTDDIVNGKKPCEEIM